jgi:signal transduction histidine kinase
METSGPEIARDAAGPLRRLLIGSARPLSPGRGLFFRYGIPIGFLALIGLGITNNQYLRDTRSMNVVVAGLLSLGAVLPVAVAVRKPVVAWRIAYPMLFLGTIMARGSESWPWAPVQIIGFLFVMLMLAFTERSAVTVWATAFSVVPPFLYTDQANALGVAVLLTVVALLGDVLSRRRQSRRALAEQTELTELERARRAVLEERTRIAREMHDVVAHHMSMIAVQAETAPYRVAGLPEPARDELATIATAARAALVEMRRLLGVLRAEDDETLRAPQPGLSEVPALVETARRAGMPVTVSLPGLDAVPAAVGLTAYRIAQEGLANAARHAPGGPVTVSGRVVADALELEIRNGPATSAPPAAAGAGHGLIGMRERAALLGGTLDAGSDGDGGYTVSATLPFGGAEDGAEDGGAEDGAEEPE